MIAHKYRNKKETLPERVAAEEDGLQFLVSSVDEELLEAIWTNEYRAAAKANKRVSVEYVRKASDEA